MTGRLLKNLMNLTLLTWGFRCMVISKKSLLFFLLLSVHFWFVSASCSGAVVLTLEQAAEIRSELNAMKSETVLLKKLSEESKADSEAWKRKCGILEERLAKASLRLANSESSLIELQEEVRTLRSLLDELKREFSELNKSYARQRKAVKFWRTAAVVSACAAVTEGVFLLIKN